MDYSRLSASDFIRESRAGSLDMKEFYSRLFTRLGRLDKKYSLFSTMAETPVKVPSKGKLAGLPVSVKDCICVEGLQSRAGSRILDSYIPPFSATAIDKIKSQGGVIIGKTNQDEFGFGTFSTNSGYGVPKNPLDPERSCGGSSGGSAGLTAALDMPHISLAESTGGSISCPAAFCGVVGLTPTYGLVSRWGLISYANSLDKIGPIGRTVDDVALMLDIISGKDSLDPTSIDRPKGVPRLDGVKGLRIGIPKEYFQGIDSRIEKQVWKGIKALEDGGAICRKVSLPLTRVALSAYYIIACSEASTNLARYCGMRYGATLDVEGHMAEYFSKVRGKYLGEEAKRRIILGTFARMAGHRDQYYLKALKVRGLIIQEFKKAFKRFDALIAPTMPILPPKFSEIRKLTPIQNYMMDVLTVAPNLAGMPQLTVPGGKVKGLPSGIHIMGNHLQERKILTVGSALCI